MQIIGVDGNEANVEERVGVHQYSFELLWAIYKLRRSWQNKYRFIIFLKSQPNKNLPKQNGNWVYKILPGGKFWILRKLTPALLSEKKIKLFFSPSHYLPLIPFIRKICTIHDLGYLKFSGQFEKTDYWQLKYWSAISIYISKYIITVSNFNKKDIVRHYPGVAKKIVVTHHGYNKSRFINKISRQDVRRVTNKYRIRRNYILCLGTLKPSKNIEGILNAFAHVSKIFVDTKLVIAGRKGWLYESIYKQAKKLRLGKKVIFTGFVSEEDKPALLSGARVFVSPSFWEGFGLHVLEAMACGTPVVVSNIASLPEVAGNAAIYVNPNSSMSIAKAMERFLKMSENEYKTFVKKSLKQASQFSWKITAQRTLEIFDKALE